MNTIILGSQVAERLGNRAGNQKVAGSIPGHACMNVINIQPSLWK